MISNDRELSINGEFTNAHFGERQLTIVASDHGDPPRETRAHIIINIQGSSTQLANNVETPKFALAPLGGLNGNKDGVSFSASSSYSESSSNENSDQSSGISALFNRATLPNSYLNTSKEFFRFIIL